MEIINELLPSILLFLSTLLTGWWLHKREMAKVNKTVLKAKETAEVSSKKSEYMPRIMSLSNSMTSGGTKASGWR